MSISSPNYTHTRVLQSGPLPAVGCAFGSAGTRNRASSRCQDIVTRWSRVAKLVRVSSCPMPVAPGPWPEPSTAQSSSRQRGAQAEPGERNRPAKQPVAAQKERAPLVLSRLHQAMGSVMEPLSDLHDEALHLALASDRSDDSGL
jgi:hypothetical protein